VFAASDFNFSDVDGDLLTQIQVTSLETVGSLQLSGSDVILNQVILKADIDAGNLTFTPLSNANGAGYDNFQFKVHDGTEYSTASYTITIDVTPIQDAPTASSNTVTTNEDIAYVFAATDFNFSDVDGDLLTQIQVTALESVGSLQLSGVNVALNQVILKADIDLGNLTFTPLSNANGVAYDNFQFKVHDGTEYSTASYTITIDVTPIQDAPTASNNTVTTNEDTAYVFAANDFNFSDVDGDLLTQIQVTTLETVGSLQLSGVNVTLNQVILKADIDLGNLTFTPLSNANGAGYDSFQFKVHDGTEYSVSSYAITIDVTPIQDAPTASSNTVTTNEDTAYVFAATDFNFSDVDGDLLTQIQVTALESVGSLQLSGVNVTLNQVILKADLDAGNLTFTPLSNANGAAYDSFQFKVHDGIEYSVASYAITIDVNAAPTAANNTVTTNEDTSYIFIANDFNFSDLDGDPLIQIQVTSLESVGSLQLSGVDVTLNQVILKADLDAGNLTFTPLSNANGVAYDNFQFKVHDGTEYSTASYTITIDVTPIQDAPTASNNTVTTNEDTAYVFAASDFNFSDVDGDLLTQIQVTTLESVGTLQLSGSDVILNQVILKADIDAGNLTFTPLSNANGVAYDNFQFKVHDGTEYSVGNYTITIDVTPIQDAPTASNNTVTTNEDTAYVFNASDFNFSDVDGDLLTQIQVTTLETVGTLQLSGSDVILNQVISKVDIDAGNLTFSPNLNDNGVAYDNFQFKVHDGTEYSVSSYAITIDVTPIQDAPLMKIQLTYLQHLTLTSLMLMVTYSLKFKLLL